MLGAYLPGIDEGFGILGSWLTNKWNQEQAAKANASMEQLLAQQNSFNSAEASKQRDWEQMMSDTAYSRAYKDMKAAGVNPILLGSGSSPASTPTGYAASSAGSHQVHTPVIINAFQNAINTSQAAPRPP